MTKLATKIADLHRPIDKALFRALSLLMAMGHAALILWEPTQYSEAIGGFNTFISPILIWAICSGVIFGLSFTPIYWVWKVVFSPYISLSVLSYFTILYIFV